MSNEMFGSYTQNSKNYLFKIVVTATPPTAGINDVIITETLEIPDKCTKLSVAKLNPQNQLLLSTESTTYITILKDFDLQVSSLKNTVKLIRSDLTPHTPTENLICSDNSFIATCAYSYKKSMYFLTITSIFCNLASTNFYSINFLNKRTNFIENISDITLSTGINYFFVLHNNSNKLSIVH